MRPFYMQQTEELSRQSLTLTGAFNGLFTRWLREMNLNNWANHPTSLGTTDIFACVRVSCDAQAISYLLETFNQIQHFCPLILKLKRIKQGCGCDSQSRKSL